MTSADLVGSCVASSCSKRKPHRRGRPSVHMFSINQRQHRHTVFARYWSPGTYRLRIGVDGSEGTAGQHTPFVLHQVEVE
jgi:hypothetical protein